VSATRANVTGSPPWAALLVLLGCGHAPPPSASSDVLAVTELAARYALDHDVPAVLREAVPICLTVDGQAPAPEVLVRLSQGPVRVSSGSADCAGPRAVLLEVRGVTVDAESATAWAGVRLGPGGALKFQKVNDGWRILQPPGQAGAGPSWLNLPSP
jgi:hypothetical protein